MTAFARTGVALLLPLALAGCYVKLHAVETTGGGMRTTTTSAQTAGTARFSHGAASFSGPRVSPSAPGGHATLGKTASGVLIVGLVLADLLNHIVGVAAPKPLSPDERIMETCSCFQKPAKGDEQ